MRGDFSKFFAKSRESRWNPWKSRRLLQILAEIPGFSLESLDLEMTSLDFD
jgi:HSP20 family molecular chaperone IbpA